MPACRPYEPQAMSRHVLDHPPKGPTGSFPLRTAHNPATASIRRQVLQPGGADLSGIAPLVTRNGPRQARRFPAGGLAKDREVQLHRRVLDQGNRPRHPAGPNPGRRERPARPHDHPGAPASGAGRETAAGHEPPRARRPYYLRGTGQDPRDEPRGPNPETADLARRTVWPRQDDDRREAREVLPEEGALRRPRRGGRA